MKVNQFFLWDGNMGQLSARVMFKTLKQAVGQHHHNDRSKVPSYCDPERIGMNRTLKAFPTETYTKRNGDEVVREVSLRSMANEMELSYKKAIGRKWQSNSCHFIDGVLTFSSSADLSDKAMLDQCALSTMDEIIKKHELREDALIEMVRHEDETRTHYHFMLKNQRLNTTSARRSFDRVACSELQDLAGAAFACMDIHRGTPKQERIDKGEPKHKYIHRTVKQLHEDLPLELAQAQAVLANCSTQVTSAEKHLDRVQKTTKLSEKKMDKVQAKTSHANDVLIKTKAVLEQTNLMLGSARLEQADAEQHKTAAQDEVNRLKALIEKLCRETEWSSKAATANSEKLSLIQVDVSTKEQTIKRMDSDIKDKQAQIKTFDERMKTKPLELKPETVKVESESSSFAVRKYKVREMVELSAVKAHIKGLEVRANIAEDETFNYKQKASRLDDVKYDNGVLAENNEALTQALLSTKDDLEKADSTLSDFKSNMELIEEITDGLGIDLKSELLKIKNKNPFSISPFTDPK